MQLQPTIRTTQALQLPIVHSLAGNLPQLVSHES